MNIKEIKKVALIKHAKWIKEIVDVNDRNALMRMSEEEIIDAFYTDLTFGTAGARSQMGLGTNRINLYTVKRFAVAYSKYILANYRETEYKAGVAIIHDLRLNSPEFALLFANILVENGIPAYINESNLFAPTPFVAYVCSQRKTIGGVVITASHNPKEYNGIKIYTQYGTQSMPEDTNKIKAFADEEKIDLSNIPTYLYNLNDVDEKRIRFLSFLDFDKYIQSVIDVLRYPNDKKTLKVVYSPLFGTTQISVPQAFKEIGYEESNFHLIKSQSQIDSSFGNLKELNIEQPCTYKVSLEYAKKQTDANKPDVIFQSDPDGDRIGMLVYNKKEKDYELISTNRIAQVFFHYFVHNIQMQVRNKALVSSYVSSNFIEVMCKKYNVKYTRLPVGPKYFCNYLVDNNKINDFLFCYEESCGFCLSPKTLDKDGLPAILVAAEILNFYKNEGKDFYDIEDEIAKTYGKYLRDARVNVMLPTGISGLETVEKLRKELNEFKVGDNFAGEKITSLDDQLKNPNPLYRSKTQHFYFGDKYNWVASRKSGTEPKFKFYINCIADTAEEAQKKLDTRRKAIINWVMKYDKDIKIS